MPVPEDVMVGRWQGCDERSAKATRKKWLEGYTDAPPPGSGDADLFKGRGNAGHDASEFRHAFASRFGGKGDGYRWYFHQDQTRTKAGALFFKPPYRRGDHHPASTLDAWPVGETVRVWSPRAGLIQENIWPGEAPDRTDAPLPNRRKRPGRRTPEAIAGVGPRRSSTSPSDHDGLPARAATPAPPSSSSPAAGSKSWP